VLRSMAQLTTKLQWPYFEYPAEHIMDHLAVACRISGDTLRQDNFYKPGQATHFGMKLGTPDNGKWNVPTMWERLEKQLGVAKRRAEAAEFNSKNKWLKRGISLIPTKFGIAFTAKYMNQGGALVHLYTDGTVLVSHGGTEMGQGLHTKVCQIAAQAFGISVDNVYVNDTSSDKVANTIPSAASFSTDMYGMATLDACRQIITRLDPIRDKLGPDASLQKIAHAAFMERIDLSAHGFFRLADSRCGYEWDKDKPADYPADLPDNSWKGHPFNYFTQGVAFCEVEVDTLTGNHRTLRSDLIVDVGSSINPAIDIGQIEGAFVQGMGWSTMEEVVYADDDHTWIRPRGKVFTTGPGTYKIPAFNDVPEAFNVSILENAENPFAVHSSKAIGEPPFFLGTGVFYAIKDAVRAARRENLGYDSYFEFRMPATSERIRMYCADAMANQATSKMLNKENAGVFYQPQGSY
jgi:xanthine dehydrogenase/oxidase